MSLVKITQLLRKEMGLASKLALKEGVRLPKGTASFDVVKVKKNDILTDIFTFKDENGKIVQRYIKKTEGKNIIETTRKYDEIESFDVPIDELETKYVWLNSRRIRSCTRTNGRISEIKEEVITHTDEKNPFMTKTVRTIKPESEYESRCLKKPKSESILIEQRRKGSKPVFIENEYQVDNFAQGDSFLVKSNVSSPELKDIAENSFFLPYTSQDIKFAHRITQACMRDANLLLEPEVVLYKSSGKTLGSFDGRILIKIKSEKGLLEPRSSLINTAGHEVGHVKWEEKVLMYDLGEKEMYTPEELSKIKKYKKAMENYTPAKVNYKKYKNNFAEVTAREEGAAASNKYMDLDSKISKVFPFLHPNQFYMPKWENLRDEGLSDILLHFGLI